MGSDRWSTNGYVVAIIERRDTRWPILICWQCGNLGYPKRDCPQRSERIVTTQEVRQKSNHQGLEQGRAMPHDHRHRGGGGGHLCVDRQAPHHDRITGEAAVGPTYSKRCLGRHLTVLNEERCSSEWGWDWLRIRKFIAKITEELILELDPVSLPCGGVFEEPRSNSLVETTLNISHHHRERSERWFKLDDGTCQNHYVNKRDQTLAQAPWTAANQLLGQRLSTIGNQKHLDLEESARNCNRWCPAPGRNSPTKKHENLIAKFWIIFGKKSDGYGQTDRAYNHYT
jgi:hypothetical protein